MSQSNGKSRIDVCNFCIIVQKQAIVGNDNINGEMNIDDICWITIMEHYNFRVRHKHWDYVGVWRHMLQKMHNWIISHIVLTIPDSVPVSSGIFNEWRS